MEAQPELHNHRQVDFDAQARLFDWIDNSRASDLQDIETLTLQLTDIDLSPLLNQAGASDSDKTVWSMYQQELQDIDQALSRLPNLQELTIIPPKMMASTFLKAMYHSVLGLLPRRCESLRLLVLYDEPTIVDVVSALDSLPKITFNEPVVNNSIHVTNSLHEPAKDRLRAKDEDIGKAGEATESKVPRSQDHSGEQSRGKR